MIRATSDNRVSSPNAAKTDARSRVIGGGALGLTGDIGLDAFQLLCPSVVIHAERFQAAVAWKFVESRFRDAQQRSPRNFLEAELHQRAWFLRVVHGRVDGIGMPGIGKEGLGLQFLDNGLKPGVLEAWKCDLAARDLACHKRAVELYAKPFAKLPIIRQRAPNSGNGRLEFDFLFDSQFDLWFRLRLRPRSINRQPPSCILFRPGQMRNLFVA